MVVGSRNGGVVILRVDVPSASARPQFSTRGIIDWKIEEGIPVVIVVSFALFLKHSSTWQNGKISSDQPFVRVISCFFGRFIVKAEVEHILILVIDATQ